MISLSISGGFKPLCLICITIKTYTVVHTRYIRCTAVVRTRTNSPRSRVSMSPLPWLCLRFLLEAAALIDVMMCFGFVVVDLCFVGGV